MTPVLRLTALDGEDLGVISAHMQDAVLLVGDMAYNKARKQFALVAMLIFKNIVDDLPRKIRVLAIKLCHRVVMRLSFHGELSFCQFCQ